MRFHIISRLLVFLLAAVLLFTAVPGAVFADGDDPGTGEGGGEIDQDEVYRQQIIERAQNLYYRICNEYDGFDGFIRLTGRDLESYENTLRQAQWFSSAVDTIMSYSEVLGELMFCAVKPDLLEISTTAASFVMDQITDGVFPKLSADQFIYSQAKSGGDAITLSRLYDFWDIFKAGAPDFEQAVDFIVTIHSNKMGFAALKMGKAYYMDQLSQSPWKYAGKLAFDLLVSQVLNKVAPEANVPSSFVEGYLFGLLENDIITLAEMTENPFIEQWHDDIAAIEAEARNLLRLDLTDPRLYPEHTVFFDPNGGQVPMESMTVHETLAYGSMPRAYRFGYGFDGWFDDPEGGKKYNNWDPYELEEDQTLYAHWTVLKIAHGSCGEDLEWALWGNGLLEITGSGAMAEAPWVEDWASFITEVSLLEGLTEICNYAFDGMSELKAITLPSTVVSLGNCVFRNSGLLSLALPEGLEHVGFGLLAGNEGVKEITFPASLTWTGYEASYLNQTMENEGDYSEANLKYGVLTHSAVERVTFGSGTTKIWDGVCSNAEALYSVSLPDTVTEIGDHSFAGCPELKTIRIPETVTAIGNGAFGMEEYIVAVAPKSRELAFEGTPTLIGAASGLESLTLPPHLQRLGKRILSGNTAVDSLVIPGTVTEAVSVTQLSAVEEVTILEGMTDLPEGMFLDGAALLQISLPESLLSVGDYAFAGTGLESLELPDGVQRLGLSILSGNRGVTELVIPASVTELAVNNESYWYPENVFSYSAVSRLEFAEGTEAIPDGVCMKMDSLNTLVLPSTVKRIGAEAFMDCYNLYELDYHPAEFPVIGEDAFLYTYLPCMLLIPDEVTLSYADAEGPDLSPWLIPDSYYTAYETVMNNGGFRWTIEDESVLRGTADGRLIILGVGTTEVVCALDDWNEPGTFTFTVSADGLDILRLPGDLTEIGAEAFAGSDIRIAELPSGVRKIGAGAFRNCSGLTRINMPDTVTEIEEGAFADSPNVTLFCESGNTAYEWALENGVNAVTER